ncbi:hypothetical protein [Salibacterium halotolerans]|uniref:Uncharacterized protein n=1 Tax=Salibacterium halotolerans TaxID=1884432 RepID=A0A1I5ND23_9BACI|nr:hypothetical protein [Salibacterium halotolerans]SFP19587.1 hypothetical protein SAMN05518683_10386 [Salibacterium halotolerans]
MQNHQHMQSDEQHTIEEQCRQYMYHDVVVTFRDGSTADGIIESVDNENMQMLVGETMMENSHAGGDSRQFGGGYGYGPQRRRYRRFRRRRFPLGALAALALLPYVTPYPYSPYYPYY